MTESKKRKFHPPQFKAKVGLEALGGMKTINQIAQEHGIHPVQVGNGSGRYRPRPRVCLKASAGHNRSALRVHLTGCMESSGD